MWPDWAIFYTLGNFSKPLATISLPKYLTFLGNFCKGVKIYHFSSEIIFGQLYRHLAIFIWAHWLRSTVFVSCYQIFSQPLYLRNNHIIVVLISTVSCIKQPNIQFVSWISLTIKNTIDLLPRLKTWDYSTIWSKVVEQLVERLNLKRLKQRVWIQLCRSLGMSPGLVVMGGDSCSEGRWFESQYSILDGHFSHWFVVKIVMFSCRKINKKRPEMAHFTKIHKKI